MEPIVSEDKLKELFFRDTIDLTPFVAFARAQKEFRSAIKDANNPFFKSKYADLSSVWDAVREPLAKYSIIVTQPIKINEAGAAYVETVIRWIDGTEIERPQCPVICKAANDPQAMGSAITYARRYSLASILGVVTDDDDGNSASQHKAPVETPADQLKTWEAEVNKLSGLPIEWTAHSTKLKGLKISDEEKVKQFNKLAALAKDRNMTYNKETGFSRIEVNK